MFFKQSIMKSLETRIEETKRKQMDAELQEVHWQCQKETYGKILIVLEAQLSTEFAKPQ